jgi:acid phosphatase type 7
VRRWRGWVRRPRRADALGAGALAAALPALLALAGCGGSQPDPPPDEPPRALERPWAEPPPRPAEKPDRDGPTKGGKREPAVVWAVGDGADGSGEAKQLADRIDRDHPDHFLYLGDVYQEGTAEDFAERYEPVYGELDEITLPTPGNHEWSNREQGYDPYWRRVRGRAPPTYYTQKVGGWELVSLNSEQRMDLGSPQHRWLEDRLEGARGTCRLGFWHRARFSAGSHHGDQDDVAPLWDALRGKATLVVAAHEHDTQRFKPRDGMVELVAGAGGDGKPLYELEEDDRLAFGNDEDHAALRLELEPGRARYAFVTADGRELDSGQVSCERK